MTGMVEAVVHEHDLRLVTLAVVICILACFTSLKLIVRAQATPGVGWAWLGAAACVFGCGVWSLHFIAMLAYMPDMAINYAIRMTIVSAGVAIAGTFVALLVWQSVPVKFTAAWFGGILLGLSVAAMHYCGVAAMETANGTRFNHGLVFTSVAVGIVFAILAFMRGNRLSLVSRRIEISVWLLLCVCSVHFIGMGALTSDMHGPMILPDGALGTGPFAVAVGSVSLAIIVVSLAATFMEQHLLQRSALELRRMQLMSDISHEILIIEKDGLILQVNEAGGRMFGITPAQLVGRRMIDLISAADQGTVARYLRSVPDHLKPESIQVQNAAGRLIPVELACSTIDYEGRPAIVMAIRDMSDRTRSEARIRHLAHHDALTDLPNRFLLQKRLTYALDTAARSRGRVALPQLNLDRFKPVNELLGHIAGDALLIQVARRLQAELVPGDTLARIGSDEFAIVMMTDRLEQVAGLAARVLETIARPFDLDGNLVEIGSSIGIALFPDDGGTLETLVQGANTAMYRVKEERGGAFRFFEAQMNEHLHARRQLEQDLRHAVDRGQFELYYQPLFSCSTKLVDGFEALLRWNHPERGLVMPLEFIPLAETTGLIDRIGQWVLQTACATAAGWDRPLRIAVNISPSQFRQANLAQIVATTLASTGLAPDRLEIEITESVLMEHTASALDLLGAIRRQGIHIVLDDFGTGYSSLSYLRSFRFDKLKIDKSFIQELGRSEDATTIVRTIIGLAHNLGMSVVAEGVENAGQLSIVGAHWCDQIQGYLLGRPVPADKLAALTDNRAALPPLDTQMITATAM